MNLTVCNDLLVVGIIRFIDPHVLSFLKGLNHIVTEVESQTEP